MRTPVEVQWGIQARRPLLAPVTDCDVDEPCVTYAIEELAAAGVPDRLVVHAGLVEVTSEDNWLVDARHEGIQFRQESI